ncbi:TAT (twin-arginine translocation) pathway signal sequence [Enhydrobacter aerosaccus]|uniref:TAT (Twin-arginine translocation) pathway signal sequence n=1 Tax=Enhydrobacter aerosaccus TaxID=225324 RepID=A0A1T4SSA3_9HYPH|nr:twin-arginine translocation signal domain-containing protein [Enhydrobacter aerosaccus]SKA31036.1 TAT (twin-arginine translocation) pathway signal sequence [Enhydrobacter aerosaccus]
MKSRRQFLHVAAGGASAALLAGCGAPERGLPVPNGQVQQATILGLSSVRMRSK